MTYLIERTRRNLNLPISLCGAIIAAVNSYLAVLVMLYKGLHYFYTTRNVDRNLTDTLWRLEQSTRSFGKEL